MTATSTRLTQGFRAVPSSGSIEPFAQRTVVREEHRMSDPFRGSYTVTVTPFIEGGARVDADALTRFLDWQLAIGVPGVIVLGTTGEFLTVTDDERAEIVETTVKHVAGRIPVLVGTMNAHT